MSFLLVTALIASTNYRRYIHFYLIIMVPRYFLRK